MTRSHAEMKSKPKAECQKPKVERFSPKTQKLKVKAKMNKEVKAKDFLSAFYTYL